MKIQTLGFFVLSSMLFTLPACFDGDFGDIVKDIPGAGKGNGEGSPKLPSEQEHCQLMCITYERCASEGVPTGFDECMEECKIWNEEMAKVLPDGRCFALEVAATQCVLKTGSCEEWNKWLGWIDDGEAQGSWHLCEAETKAVSQACWEVADS